jgi:hypothetical protein
VFVAVKILVFLDAFKSKETYANGIMWLLIHGCSSKETKKEGRKGKENKEWERNEEKEIKERKENKEWERNEEKEIKERKEARKGKESEERKGKERKERKERKGKERTGSTQPREYN